MGNEDPSALEGRIQRFVQINARIREATLESEKEFLKSAGNISAAQLQVVLTVGDHPDCTMSVIANALHFSKANVTQMVDRLVRGGYLKKVKSEQDRRITQVKLLSKGKNIVQLSKQHVEQVARDWFGRMTEDEQEAVLSLLDRYF
jgi:DNA-binding MarR family transcriptional regulator